MLWKASTSLLENFTRCSINPEWDSDIVVVWWFVLSLHPKKCWDFDMTLNFHECLTIETLRGHGSWFVLESDMSEANSDFHWMSEDCYQLYNVSTLKFAKLLPTLNMVWESYNLGKMLVIYQGLRVILESGSVQVRASLEMRKLPFTSYY